ncbi:MAG TPA: NUDIX hydrolase [Candidatus Gracilibacteria bacterium]|nr:NUDIX hydrolase [Candidatus Gracilibacteria bacterium]
MKLIITAGAIIFNEKKQILLVKRPENKKLFPGFWSIPGGKMEENENLTTCVIREVKEETNLDFLPERNYLFQEYIKDDIHNISHIFMGKYQGKILENDLVKWFSISDLSEEMLAFDYYQLICNAVLGLK